MRKSVLKIRIFLAAVLLLSAALLTGCVAASPDLPPKTVSSAATEAEAQPTLPDRAVPAPTEVTTDPPTEVPTEVPTEAPTEVTTESPTAAPTEAPTEAPTAPPTEAPTAAPTEAPTAPPTEAPTDSPTEPPTEPPTEATLPERQTPEIPAASGTQETPDSPDAPAARYVVNVSTKKFHFPDCSSVKSMKAENRMDFFGSRDELIAGGYEPCKRCNP